MRLRSAATLFLPVLVVAIACGPIGGSADSPSTTQGDDSGPPSGPPLDDAGHLLMAPNGYYVSGNQVYDATGKSHLFRGLDRPGTEWSAGGDHLSEADFQIMAEQWNANIVRIPMNQDFWLNDPANANYASNYASNVKQLVKWAEKYGMDVILDLHWSDQGDYSKGCPGANNNCQQCMADAHSQIFWSQVAAAYQDDGHVLFELYNEPHDVSWGTWLGGGPASCKSNGNSGAYTAYGMQQLYDAVRATGAQNLVIVGGLNWAYDLSGVPGNRVKGYNIMYNTHPYASKASAGTFGSAFGSLAATDPVIATEFGNSDCSAGFYQSFTQYAQTNGIHWTAWAYYVASCGFPALISDYSGTPVPGSGETVQMALLNGGTGPRPPQLDTGTDAGADSGSADGGATEAGDDGGGADGAAD
jgi:hypothetical protein